MEDNLPVLHFKSILLIAGFTLRQFLNSATLSPSNKVHYSVLCQQTLNRVVVVTNESALDLLVFELEISKFYDKYCNFCLERFWRKKGYKNNTASLRQCCEG
jgi:hypothetical protein